MRIHKFANMQDMVVKAKSLYESGKNTYEIASILGKSRGTVSLYLKNAGVTTRKDSHRKYSVDHEFFSDINTHSKAYWLGFILADGHIDTKRNCVRIELQRQDRSHLQKFLESVKSNSELKDSIRTRTQGGKTYYSSRCVVCSVAICRDLISLGSHEYKTGISTRVLENILPDLLPSFARGLFDADGSFYRPTATFIDQHHANVDWFASVLVNFTYKPVKFRVHRNAKSCSIYGVNSLRSFGEYLYSTPGPLLERKRNTWLKLISP